MAKSAQKHISINWREGVRGDDAGCRLGCDQTTRVVERIMKSAGFVWHAGVAQWTALEAESACKLTELFASRGYLVEHAGRWPDGPHAALRDQAQADEDDDYEGRCDALYAGAYESEAYGYDD